jgi:diguanylate cyclase
MSSDVISLKRSIEAHEQREMLFRKAVDSYLFALDSVWRHNKDLPGVLPHTRLPELSKQLHHEVTAQALDESRAELELALRRLMEANQWQEGEIREILKSLAAATAALTDRSSHYTHRLTSLAGQLEALAQTDDLLLLRVGLQARVSEFRECIENMHSEHAVGLQKMIVEMQEFRQRLERVEQETSLDALTGLPNRRAGESKIEDLIIAQKKFSIILLDLNRFKSINDRFGHLAGDATLREFGRRLRGAARQRDFAARWGGDEFLVIVESAMPEAISLSRRLYEVISGRYAITVNDNSLRVMVTASMGVAEHRAGEKMEQVFARADACLYEAKGPM